MSDFYTDAWYDARWNSLPLAFKRRAVDVVQQKLDPTMIELIRKKHAEYGRDWIHYLIDVPQEERDHMNTLLPDEYQDDLEEHGWPATMSAHHGFGTSIRNLLRDPVYGAGILDVDLPDAPYEDGSLQRNWDDFYVAVLEAAVGLR